MERMIEIPYCPRPIWKDVIHPALDTYKRAVLVCHRRFGKSVGVINHLEKKAITNPLRAPQYAYIGPFRNQAKRIAWEYLKYYTRVIPGIKVNESELYVQLPTQHKGSPGARIYIVGADKPDSLRGMYLDGVVLDEYSQIRRNLFGEIIAPALIDRNGFAWFLGTPNGQDHFYEIYQKALKDQGRWFSCLYRVDETHVLTDEQFADLTKDMTPEEIRREFYCDFSASASNVVMPIELVTKAAQRKITPDQVAGMSRVLAVDVARFGDDSTKLQRRQGLIAPPVKSFHGMDTMAVAAAVVAEIVEYRPDATFIDVGAMGAGVIDRIRQLGYSVIEVNFESKAQNSERFENLRAEMYFKTRDWLMQGGCIDNNPDLKTELSVTEYKYSKTGRIILQPKEEIKEKLGRSPDNADALAMTFAYPVATRAARQAVAKANTEYYFE